MKSLKDKMKEELDKVEDNEKPSPKKKKKKKKTEEE